MRNLTMMTDLYQLTMMYGYYKNNIHNRKAVFDMYFRKPGENSAYAIAAGLEQVIDYIENLHFSEEDILYLDSLNLFDKGFFDILRELRFTGDIHAVPEGTVVFPNEPMVRVKAPLIEAQLIETAFAEYHQSSNAYSNQGQQGSNGSSRQQCLEFGLRRAQGRMQVSMEPEQSNRGLFCYIECYDRSDVRYSCQRHTAIAGL